MKTGDVNPHSIPDALKRVPNWVVWRYETREGKQTKVPKCPHAPERNASVSDPNTWADFRTALKASTRCDGVGFVLTPEVGITAFDFDHCLREDGTCAPDVWELVRILDSYTEVTPSGRGLRVLCYGKLPDGRRRRGSLEMYCDSRFVTVTGRHMAGTPQTIEFRQAEIERVHRMVFGDENEKPAPAPAPATDLTDSELLAKAMHAANGEKFKRLWEGDDTGYPSASEADCALMSMLLFWTAGDVARAERLFSSSPRGQREKWQRRDYRRRTIEAALAHKTTFYEPHHRRNGQDGTDTDSVEPEPEKTYRHLLHLRELFAGRYRWCPEWKTWLHWNGQVWERVPHEAVVSTATEELRSYYARRVAEASSHGEGEKWTKRLMDVFTTSHVSDAVDLLRGYAGFLIYASEFDANPYVLNCRNGLLDLRTLTLKPHDPDALCTKMVHADYDPSADAPTWKRFLHEIFAGDTELIAFMQRACGMALIGENRHHLLFILHGAGGNGKSTFLHALRYTLGGYAGAIPRDALLARKHQQDAQRTAYSALIGLRFGTLEELADDVTLSVVAVKDLTSNNPMQVRALYENYREVRLGLTPFVAVNTKPSVTEHTEGTWRRLRLVPFTVTIPPEKRDPELPQKLEREADGILAWLVVGLREYWRCGLQEPPAVMEATREYRSEQDVLEGFITECCEISPRALTPSAELYNAYKQWAVQNGESEDELLSERAFGQRLTKRGFPTARGTDAKRTRLRKGLRLKMHVSDVSDVSDVDSEKSVRENDSGGLFGNNVRNVQNVQTHPSHDVACRNEPPPDYPVRDGRTGWCGVCQTTTVHRPYRLSNGMVHWQCVQCATVRLLEVPDG
jgi:putative DNA primase/helicase